MSPALTRKAVGVHYYTEIGHLIISNWHLYILHTSVVASVALNSSLIISQRKRQELAIMHFIQWHPHSIPLQNPRRQIFRTNEFPSFPNLSGVL